MTEKPREGLKSDRIYEALRHRIRLMELSPGAPLNRDEIAAEFGVSRAPVTDACLRLAEEGLVEIYPQHGSFVAQVRPEDVREGLFIRRALEIEAVRCAAALRSPDLCATLRENIEEQEQALARGDLVGLYALDEAMHAAIFSAVSAGRAIRILETARAPADRMRRLVLPNEGRPQATIREHRWIVDAICSGDPAFADAAMRAHLNGLAGVIEGQLELLGKNSAA